MSLPDFIPIGKVPHRQAPPDAITIAVPDAARLTGLAESTIWQLVNKGIIPSRAYGSRRLIRRDDLDRWTASLPERRAS